MAYLEYSEYRVGIPGNSLKWLRKRVWNAWHTENWRLALAHTKRKIFTSQYVVLMYALLLYYFINIYKH